MSTLITFCTYVLLPVFLLTKLWNHRSNDLIKWLCYIAGVGAYVLFIYFAGLWPLNLAGYYMRYVLILGLVISVAKSYFNVKREVASFSVSHAVSVCVVVSVCLFQAWGLWKSFFSEIPKAIGLEFPLKTGKYYIAHGGCSAMINHHFELDAQKYALDIIKLDGIGLRQNGLSSCELKDYHIYGDVIHSPCDGKIVELLDGFDDLEPGTMDSEHPAGNYLVIEKEGGDAVVILAHIMKGSFVVKKDDLIQTGQKLALVGNSGNTSEPHLHIHMAIAKAGDFLFTGKGIPMKFNDRFLYRNDIVHSLSMQNQSH